MSEKEKTMDITVKSYQMLFPRLTKKIFEEQQKLYQRAVIEIRLDNLQEHAAYMKRCNKPTSGGTKITFCAVKSSEEYKRELERIIADGEKLGMKFEKEKKQEKGNE